MMVVTLNCNDTGSLDAIPAGAARVVRLRGQAFQIRW